MLRALPTRLFDRALDALGVNRTMDHFTARPTPPLQVRWDGAARQTRHPPAKGGSTSTSES